MSEKPKSRYTITIVERTVEVRKRGAEWELGAGATPTDYGYTPEIDKHVDVERTVLLQNIDTLDMAKVIKAINNLEGETHEPA